MASNAKRRRSPDIIDISDSEIIEPISESDEDKVQKYLEVFVNFLKKKAVKCDKIQLRRHFLEEFREITGRELPSSCQTREEYKMFYERVVPIILKSEIEWEVKAKILFLTSTSIFCATVRKKLRTVAKIKWDNKSRITSLTDICSRKRVTGKHNFEQDGNILKDKGYYKQLQTDAVTLPRITYSDIAQVEEKNFMNYRCQRIHLEAFTLLEIFAYRLTREFTDVADELAHLAVNAHDAQARSYKGLSNLIVHARIVLFLKRLTVSSVTYSTQHDFHSVLNVLNTCFNSDPIVYSELRKAYRQTYTNMIEIKKNISGKTLLHNLTLFYQELLDRCSPFSVERFLHIDQEINQEIGSEFMTDSYLLIISEYTNEPSNFHYQQFFKFMNHLILRIRAFYPEECTSLDLLASTADEYANLKDTENKVALVTVNYYFIRFIEKMVRLPKNSEDKTSTPKTCFDRGLKTIWELLYVSDEFSSMKPIGQKYAELYHLFLRRTNYLSPNILLENLNELFQDINDSSRPETRSEKLRNDEIVYRLQPMFAMGRILCNTE